jgi:hypothetical protein
LVFPLRQCNSYDVKIKTDQNNFLRLEQLSNLKLYFILFKIKEKKLFIEKRVGENFFEKSERNYSRKNLFLTKRIGKIKTLKKTLVSFNPKNNYFL